MNVSEDISAQRKGQKKLSDKRHTRNRRTLPELLNCFAIEQPLFCLYFLWLRDGRDLWLAKPQTHSRLHALFSLLYKFHEKPLKPPSGVNGAIETQNREAIWLQKFETST